MSVDPKKARYSKTHEWVSLENNICTIGITKFAADQLTDITFVELPDVGDPIFAGKDFGYIETVKAVSDLYSPLDGEVLEVNLPLEEDPTPLQKDPFGKGWLLKIRLDKPTEISSLMSFEQYQKQIESDSH